jgi:hypothetical protein
MEPARTYTIKPMLSIKSANTNHILCSRTEIEPQCDLIHQGSPNPQMNRSSRNKADESILSTSQRHKGTTKRVTQGMNRTGPWDKAFSVSFPFKNYGVTSTSFFSFSLVCVNSMARPGKAALEWPWGTRK